MGLFSFLSGNYKPSDFANKTLEQIFKEIKLDKVDKSIQQDAEFNALPDETKSAIQMLIDLKEGKNIIYDKCYKGKGTAHAHAAAPTKPHSYHPTVPAELPTAVPNKPTVPGSSRPKPMSFAKPVPVEKAPEPEPVEDEKEGQTGGGRKGRKSRRSSKTGKKNKKSRRTKKSRKHIRK